MSDQTNSPGGLPAVDAAGFPEPRKIRVRNYSGVIYVVWTVLILGSVGWNYYQGQRAALEAARTQAHSAYDRDLVYRDWAEQWGGVYVPVTEATPPNPNLDIPERELTTVEGMHLALVNHAYMTRQVYDLARTDFGMRGHMTRLNPLRKESTPDAWETRALQAVGGDSNDFSGLDVVDGKEYMRLMHPLVNERSCLHCHGDNGDKLGATIGGISVGVPMEPFRQAERVRMAHLASGHAVLWGAGVAAVALGARRMRRQVQAREQLEGLLRDAEAESRELHRQVSHASRLLEDAFGRYVDPRVVSEIIKADEPLHLGGERKLVTVLMSDIRDFTVLSETLEAETLVEFLNEYFSAMAEIVFAHEGTLDKFMGDAIIVLFGAPVAREDDALRAVRTALEMRRKLKELNAQWAARGAPSVEIGIGLSTGEMVVGNIGSPKRHDYTAIGKDVNIAKRLESLTKKLACDILVSETTHALVRGHVDTIDFGAQAIRGIEEPVQVYGISQLRNDAGRYIEPKRPVDSV